VFPLYLVLYVGSYIKPHVQGEIYKQAGAKGSCSQKINCIYELGEVCNCILGLYVPNIQLDIQRKDTNEICKVGAVKVNSLQRHGGVHGLYIAHCMCDIQCEIQRRKIQHRIQNLF